MIEVRNLKKTYQQGDHRVEALKGVSLKIEHGQFACIMGPSGSGKSTFLHLAGGLDRPSAGQVLVEGRAIDELSDNQLSRFRRQRLGFIFQFFNLLPTLTALENVAFPLLIDGAPMAKVKPRAEAMLEMMGLQSRMNHRPDQLSGGQMQRVAIARALVTNPALILADEPTGNLDSETGAQVLELLAKLCRERKQTILMVTHDPKAATYGNRTIRFRDGNVETDQVMPGLSAPRMFGEPGREFAFV